MKRSLKHTWNVFTDVFQDTIFHPQYFTFQATKKGISLAKKYAHGTLVDVGCGRMPYREILEPKLDRYIGIDHPETSSIYRGKWKPDIYADAKKIPLPSRSTDIVLLLQVLEYLDDPHKAFREVFRILKQGGIVIISVPFMYPIHDVPYDLARYTEPAIKDLLNSGGFSILAFSAEGTFFDFWGQSLNVFLMKRIKDILRRKKNLLSWLYLFFLIAISIPAILISNIIVLLFDKIGILFPKYPNYFPLDYVIVAKKTT